MSSINFRRMMAPKREPLFPRTHTPAPVTAVHALQQRMMEFYRDNTRCVINAPRRSGKSMLLIMQAILSNTDVIIITNKRMTSETLTRMMTDFCDTNNIEYDSQSWRNNVTGGISVEFRNILITEHNRDIESLIRGSTNAAVFIDEYDYIPLAQLPIREVTNVLLIGTPTGRSATITEGQIGLFAGLNINDDGENRWNSQ